MSDKGPCTNHGIFLNNNTVQQYGTHPDKCFILYCACMQNRTMTYINQSFTILSLTDISDNLGINFPVHHHHDHIGKQHINFKQDTTVC
jgi:hypothetical protein